MPDHNNNSLHIQTRLTLAPQVTGCCSAAAFLRVQRPRDMFRFQLSRLENDVVPRWGQSNCARDVCGNGGPNGGNASP